MKIKIKMMGGLGNQMFQYAFAYIFLKKYPSAEAVFDTRLYKKYYWPFGLTDFSIPSKYEILDSGKEKYDLSISYYHVYQKIYGILHNEKPNFISKRNQKRNYLFCGTWCDLPTKILETKDVILYGYFQNADLLEPIRNDLCNIFSLNIVPENVSSYLKQIKTNNIVVSIRFLSDAEKKHIKKENTLPDDSFYEEAIGKLIAENDIDQVVFTSNRIDLVRELEWVKKLTKDILFIENCSATEQIEIMKKCKHFVISNSTFSWWGAYLGSYINKGTVIAPKIWERNKDIKKSKVLFKEMIVLD